MTKVPDGQRALVLQGGGSLGAYEAGAYQALYERISKTDREKGENNKPFLNIVAGTSIGAINAAIIKSYVVETDTWNGSAERLNEFWEYLSKESSFDQMPGFTAWWDYLHNNIHSGIASGEAARRYYSAMEFSITGVPTVFSPLTLRNGCPRCGANNNEPLPIMSFTFNYKRGVELKFTHRDKHDTR